MESTKPSMVTMMHTGYDVAVVASPFSSLFLSSEDISETWGRIGERLPLALLILLIWAIKKLTEGIQKKKKRKKSVKQSQHS